MTTEFPSRATVIREFGAFKQIKLFKNLKQAKFSGSLIFNSVESNKKWIFLIYLGDIVYATGGEHPVRRWKRGLNFCLPHASELLQELKLNPQIKLRSSTYWEYEVLGMWLSQGKISRQAAINLVRTIVIEILFDITQLGQVACKLTQKKIEQQPAIVLDSEQIIVATWKQWQVWQSAKMADRSPDLAAVIKQPENLKNRTSENTYKALVQLLDGKHSLRDLAIKTKLDLLHLTRSLVPYVQQGLIGLIKINDLPLPIALPQPQPSNKSIEVSNSKLLPSRQPLIGCIDDSIRVCREMETIITAAGYRYFYETDGLRAIASILARKPDFLFLDLVMPETNGYELCTKLRRAREFSRIPIVIFTANINLIDRVRAKIAGCSELLPKPLTRQIIISTINKHLV